MTSSSASEASLVASASRGRREDAKDSARPTLTSCQPLAKPHRRLPLRSAVPAAHVSSPQDAATFPPGGRTASTSACGSLYPSRQLPRARGAASVLPDRGLGSAGRATQLCQEWACNHQHLWPRYKELITAIGVQEGTRTPPRCLCLVEKRACGDSSRSWTNRFSYGPARSQGSAVRVFQPGLSSGLPLPAPFTAGLSHPTPTFARGCARRRSAALPLD